MHTFLFPNGDFTNVEDFGQSMAVAALSPVGTMMWHRGDAWERSERGMEPCDSAYAEQQSLTFHKRAEKRAKVAALARVQDGADYTLASRAVLR